MADVYDGSDRMNDVDESSGTKGTSSEESHEGEIGTDACEYPSIRFFRSEKVRDQGGFVSPRNQYNAHTAYLDLSQVYGNEEIRDKVLRKYEDGKMLVSDGDYL
ncbi:unnamed protein product, partial [Ostreobium quekettii]